MVDFSVGFLPLFLGTFRVRAGEHVRSVCASGTGGVVWCGVCTAASLGDVSLA